MDGPADYEEIGKQFAVIARSRKIHTDQFRRLDIIKEISDKFAQYISKHDILYVPPNFVIYLNCPHVQKDMLSEPTIRTQNFELDVLPWSREHELAQLPWIIDGPSNENEIIIEPLTILPVTSDHARYPGRHILKDDYAAMMAINYDLKAPDFSYLMITELKEFYYNKHNLPQ